MPTKVPRCAASMAIEKRLKRVHQPEHVGIENRAEYRGVLTVLRQRAHGYAGVADDDVGCPEAPDKIGRGAAQCIRVAHIADVRCAGRGSKRGGHRCQCFTSPREQSECRATTRVMARERFADTGAGARDEDVHGAPIRRSRKRYVLGRSARAFAIRTSSAAGMAA